MSIRISLSLTDDAGSPSGESFKASCSLEVDQDPTEPQNAEASRRQIDVAFAACAKVVCEELKAAKQSL